MYGQFKIEEQLSNCDQDVAQIIRGWLEENTKDIFHEFVKLAYKFDSDFMTCMAESDTFMALMDGSFNAVFQGKVQSQRYNAEHFHVRRLRTCGSLR